MEVRGRRRICKSCGKKFPERLYYAFGNTCPTCIQNPIKNNMSIDKINPDHYKVGGIENWDYLMAKLTPEEIKGHCKACIIKYLARAKHKGSAQENYEKAQWYMNKLVGLANE